MPLKSVEVNLEQVRANVADIRRRVGVEVWAVVKADAYGMGMERVAPAIAELVDGFCVFSLREAQAGRLWEVTGKPAIALGPPDSADPAAYRQQHVRPAVSTIEQATALRPADPVLCVDTGMQRFACPAEQVEAVLTAGECREAFTHAVRVEQAQLLKQLTSGHHLKLHAAATALLDQPEARLDAVRPGLALYQQAVTVRTALVEVHVSRPPVGYGGFSVSHHGVIPVGYVQGLRRGICLIAGQRRMVLEVGMQSAYVEIGPEAQVGDEVILLGPELPPHDLAPFWNSSPHEALLRLGGR